MKKHCKLTKHSEKYRTKQANMIVLQWINLSAYFYKIKRGEA